jgi:riboflavin biosynthesis pyrimidine reductase
MTRRLHEFTARESLITREGPSRRTKLRRRVQAILVGGGTVRADDPQLTVRGVPVSLQPLRVVWTKSGRLPETARIFTDEHRDRTLVFKGISFRSALRELGRLGVESVLIEGGARVLGEAFDRSLVDEVCFYLHQCRRRSCPTTGWCWRYRARGPAWRTLVQAHRPGRKADGHGGQKVIGSGVGA